MTTKHETTGQPTERSTGRVIRMSAALDATPEQAWKVLTMPEELSRWFPLRSGGTPGPDGKVLLSWGDDAEWWTNITVWKPHQHLQWTDTPVPGAPPPLVMDWYITTEKGKTVVRGVHSGFGAGADWDAMYDGMEAGWTFFMRNLEHYVERHFGTPRDMVFARRKTTLPTATAWQRLTSSDGLEVSGDRMRFGGADGHVEYAKPGQRLWGTLAGLNDSLLFIEFEGGGESYNVGIWLSTYGLPRARVQQLQSEMNDLAARALEP
ncbi:MAG TPA: SRPBCC domain-containing protein [Gemmatimonadaceae bacterium]|nr:SRPBCC domain-containing protein [Gemmatimonadaceae bacterium]